MSKRAQLPRRRRSGLASFVGLVIVALCVLGAIAAIQIAQDHDRTVLGEASWVAERLRTRDWSDVGVLVAGIVCAALGFLLLLAGLFPARRPFVRLVDPDEHTIAGITRAGLVRDLSAVAAGVDGVSSARAKVGRKRVRVTVRSALRDSSGLREAVHEAVRQRVESLQPERPLSVATRVRAGGE